MSISFVIFLQILFLISTVIQGEDKFDCTGYEDDSYHPIYDADDCRHYWHCIYVNTVYMHAVKRICPAGTEFDIALRQCETASEVDCVLVKSPHIPRTTSTTKSWKWIYSKLISRINRKPTIPYFVTTRSHSVFDLGDAADIDTTTIITPEIETTEQIQVLPFTLPKITTTSFSLEQLSKNLHALVVNHHPSKSHHSGANFIQPGEPENEAEVYTSTTKRRTRLIRYTTQSTTSFPLTTLLFTTETTTTTTTTTTIAFTTTTILTTTSTDTSSLTSTSITTISTELDTTIHIKPQSRMGVNGRYRRNNMTLYILTSDDHKIRQFSVNHTRGILINCNQLRRRLLGRRRRLRDTIQITSTQHTLILKNSSIQIFQYNILLLTIFSLIFLQK